MQNLENDLDELFRKAVDQVPLHPGDSRWNEIAVKLTGNSTTTSADHKIISRKNINGTGRKVLLTAVTIAILATFISQEEKNSMAFPVSKTRHSDKEINAVPKMPVKKIKILATYKSGVHKKTTEGENFKYSKEILLSQDRSGFRMENQLKDPEVPAIIKGDASSLQDRLNTITQNNIPQTNKPIELSESAKKTANLTPHHLNSTYNHGFYFGLATGPVFSQIKTQAYNKPGFDVGILIGYKINRKISIETGLLYTAQYYSASGKYYNQVTGGNTTNSLDGSRTAFEIPFKLNYTVFHGRTGSFFIAGGFSTYVGANDNITINVGDNTPNPPQKLDYGMASYLPSYLDFSIGYEYRIGKFAQVRLEPYVEIPMSSTAGNTIMNAGGSLQIVNSGLHIAITRFMR